MNALLLSCKIFIINLFCEIEDLGLLKNSLIERSVSQINALHMFCVKTFFFFIV